MLRNDKEFSVAGCKSEVSFFSSGELGVYALSLYHVQHLPLSLQLEKED